METVDPDKKIRVRYGDSKNDMIWMSKRSEKYGDSLSLTVTLTDARKEAVK